MSDKSNRRFWQIHLSTAIVLMFVAGGLIWANVSGAPYMYCIEDEAPYGSHLQGWTDCVGEMKGWPLRCQFSAHGWHVWHTFADATVVLGIIVATIFASEYLIRRFETRKP